MNIHFYVSINFHPKWIYICYAHNIFDIKSSCFFLSFILSSFLPHLVSALLFLCHVRPGLSTGVGDALGSCIFQRTSSFSHESVTNDQDTFRSTIPQCLHSGFPSYIYFFFSFLFVKMRRKRKKKKSCIK